MPTSSFTTPTDFNVHKFVLHHVSAYFRTYFDTQSESESADSSVPAAKKTKTCNHSSAVRCIHLPQQTTLDEKQVVAATDFGLFLRHLYFSAHYCYPPFLPKTDVDLDAQHPPLSLNYPALTSLNWVKASPLRLTSNGEQFVFNEALLTLAHYFDCAAMMAQCEAVLLRQLDCGRKRKAIAELVEMCMDLLQYAERYHLAQCKKACIDIIAADKGLLEREAYKAAKQQWSRALMMGIIESVVKRKS